MQNMNVSGVTTVTMDSDNKPHMPENTRQSMRCNCTKDHDEPHQIYLSQEHADTAILFRMLQSLMARKSRKYREPPVNFMDMDLLIAQITIKALRVRETIDPDDTMDELQDLIVYAIHALRRMRCDAYESQGVTFDTDTGEYVDIRGNRSRDWDDLVALEA